MIGRLFAAPRREIAGSGGFSESLLVSAGSAIAANKFYYQRLSRTVCAPWKPVEETKQSLNIALLA